MCPAPRASSSALLLPAVTPHRKYRSWLCDPKGCSPSTGVWLSQGIFAELSGLTEPSAGFPQAGGMPEAQGAVLCVSV